MTGGWKIADMQPGNLPEKVATAFGDVTQALRGATYVPVLYCGEQVVHGMNYMIICKQKLATLSAPEHIVKMVINCCEEGSSIVEIEQIV